MRLIILICAGLLVACTGTQQRQICENSGGKWGSVESKCYRPSCVKNGTCKDWDWSDSAEYCPKVTLGMDKSTVVFWLGNPNEQNYQRQNTLSWYVNKVDSDQISATFVNEKLTTLECPNYASHISLEQ
ncbi:Uncharacterised protein [Moraxella lacunata]|uniref:Uncharacterized protein n=1 Tax=Moraxella lacunata TaxID=477 RepID=A0A378T8K2_MORLA|nr:hypothetical protein [Moraxella lacunata]STZ55866.1 Uncharacterised protein [Moraxella lacunata]